MSLYRITYLLLIHSTSPPQHSIGFGSHYYFTQKKWKKAKCSNVHYTFLLLHLRICHAMCWRDIVLRSNFGADCITPYYHGIPIHFIQLISVWLDLNTEVLIDTFWCHSLHLYMVFFSISFSSLWHLTSTVLIYIYIYIYLGHCQDFIRWYLISRNTDAFPQSLWRGHVAFHVSS